MDGSALSPFDRAGSGSPLAERDAARVARAAAELGVPVPRRFRLVGVDEDGSCLAELGGTAQEVRHGIAIMARLDGKSVDESLAAMESRLAEGAAPDWTPPADLTDLAAMLAWLEERELHPEWPRIENSLGDWAPIVAAFLGGSIGVKALADMTKSIHNERVRLAFARYVVDQAIAQGRQIDPEALIKAINSIPGDGSSAEPGQGPAALTGRAE